MFLHLTTLIIVLRLVAGLLDENSADNSGSSIHRNGYLDAAKKQQHSSPSSRRLLPHVLRRADSPYVKNVAAQTNNVEQSKSDAIQSIKPLHKVTEKASQGPSKLSLPSTASLPYRLKNREAEASNENDNRSHGNGSPSQHGAASPLGQPHCAHGTTAEPECQACRANRERRSPGPSPPGTPRANSGAILFPDSSTPRASEGRGQPGPADVQRLLWGSPPLYSPRYSGPRPATPRLVRGRGRGHQRQLTSVGSPRDAAQLTGHPSSPGIASPYAHLFTPASRTSPDGPARQPPPPPPFEPSTGTPSGQTANRPPAPPPGHDARPNGPGPVREASPSRPASPSPAENAGSSSNLRRRAPPLSPTSKKHQDNLNAAFVRHQNLLRLQQQQQRQADPNAALGHKWTPNPSMNKKPNPQQQQAEQQTRQQFRQEFAAQLPPALQRAHQNAQQAQQSDRSTHESSTGQQPAPPYTALPATGERQLASSAALDDAKDSKAGDIVNRNTYSKRDLYTRRGFRSSSPYLRRRSAQSLSADNKWLIPHLDRTESVTMSGALGVRPAPEKGSDQGVGKKKGKEEKEGSRLKGCACM